MKESFPLTETAKQLAADNPWLSIAQEIEDTGYENPNYAVHPEDRCIVEKYNASASEKHRLRLNLPPEPFQGNPLTAEVVILMLNPGFVERCNVDMYNKLGETDQRAFIKAKCATMSMQDKWCVPTDEFMDNRMAGIINDIGENYWERKLRYVFDAVPDANKKIAVINLLGYSSTKYRRIPKRAFDHGDPLLYTQVYTLRLVEWLMKQGKVLIIRSKKWLEVIRLEGYEKSVLLKSPLNPTVSPGNCKEGDWEKIITALTKEKLSEINEKGTPSGQTTETSRFRNKAGKSVGNIHPNGKWVWTEYAPGKFDWRVIKK
jgi:hypothetical protein